ncbi:MAG: DUF86 domain-containing protein [Tannerellaceae bacterium]|jgi:uncharacterized protein with HEPN domain|nr:DUF86 domain-containing protein [Tannerellaceae bacterium]
MTKDSDQLRLKHIRQSIEKVEQLAHTLHTCGNFESKWVERYALLYCLEVIGEASINISEDLKEAYPDVAWKEMRGLRNIIVHQYYYLSLTIIWDVVINDIPVLKGQVMGIIKDINNK